MIETCKFCGSEMRRSEQIRIFKRTWRKKITVTCPNCGNRTLTLTGARSPGDALKAADAVAKLGESTT